MDLNKKKGVVIFDCDGVMFDSRQANINYYNHMLAKFGLSPISGENIDYVHMHTADEAIRRIFQGSGHLEQALELRKNVDYTPFINDMVIEPGLKELLNKLQPGFGLAVATNRSNTIAKVIELKGLNGFFDIIVSSLDVTNPKPDPESVQKILDYFHVGPDKTFYIGDSLLDQQTAQASRVRFISFKNKSLEADFHADSMMSVESIIEDQT